MQQLNRRDFLKISAILAGSAWLTTVTGCDAGALEAPVNPVDFHFAHGVASGDPTPDSVILWTRLSPALSSGSAPRIRLLLEVSEQADFSGVVQKARLEAGPDSDYCVKVDFKGLQSGRTYYYRFSDQRQQSPVGLTRTLPVGALAQARFAVVSCSNYPAGYFHVYDAIARLELDAVIHLGDYIYEYPHDGYASEDAKRLGRELAPDNQGETVSLSDYRKRYARYRADPALQAVHAQQVFWLVWDDHEISNDAWLDGAENHQASEGSFAERKLAALQAYFEWMPIRPRVQDGEPLYRAVQYGELARLILLDSRIIGRDEPIDLAKAGTDAEREALLTTLSSPRRQLLGQPQQDWLAGQFQQAAAAGQWAVLAQQVLMARMTLPQEVLQKLAEPALAVAAQTSAGAEKPAATQDPAAGQADLQQWRTELLQQLQQLADWQAQQASGSAVLGNEQLQRLQQPRMPYNLDAWDGYPAAREALYQAAAVLQKPLLVLAGDTHNAWSASLKDASGRSVGVEFATASVSSPGIESYLQMDDGQITQLEALLPQLIDELELCELRRRGYLLLSLTAGSAEANWFFVDSIKQPQYQQTLGLSRQVTAR